MILHPQPMAATAMPAAGGGAAVLQSLSNHRDASAAAAAAVVTSGEEDAAAAKIVAEFQHLLEKSKQLFNGLRDLPPYGHKQWQGYFGRTFDIYTKLWKFQQQHRAVLDSRYGLKRWQIGDIASKIGQLYYHYYLRTSETGYLNESFSFYSAIRGRAYYSRASASTGGARAEDNRMELLVKRLRYSARFVLVCLLLKKMKLVRELAWEMGRQVEEMQAVASAANDEEQLEWSLVLSEVKAFVEAESVVNVLDSDSNTIVLSHRLNPLITPPVEKSPAMSLSLQEVILVGAKADQTKFGEMTLDMFRLIQTLEREPQPQQQLQQQQHSEETVAASSHDLSSSAPRIPLENGSATAAAVSPGSSKREANPHKYLLYRPTVSQLLLFLSSGLRDLPSNGAILLFISADGFPSTSASTSACADAGSTHPRYDQGGVLLSSSKRVGGDQQTPRHGLESSGAGSPRANGKRASLESNCLYPGDLLSFTRRPLFMVVDSDNADAFEALHGRSATNSDFDQPLVVLRSPKDTSSALQGLSRGLSGSVYSLFLHSPLSAFCLLSGVAEVPIHLWDKCLAYVDRFTTEASRLVTAHCLRGGPGGGGPGAHLAAFLGDDFLRLLVCRHVFACVALEMHKDSGSGPSFQPSMRPALPRPDVLGNPTLRRYALDLAKQMDVSAQFHQDASLVD